MLILSRISVGVSLIFSITYLTLLHNKHPYLATAVMAISVVCVTAPLASVYFSKNKDKFYPLACETGCAFNLIALLVSAIH
jgi:hypothetical protein